MEKKKENGRTRWERTGRERTEMGRTRRTRWKMRKTTVGQN